MMALVILIPVKDPAQAKTRLSPLLTQAERERLAWVMLEDLVRVLGPLKVPVVLATSSEKVSAMAHDIGWRVLLERQQSSESESVDAASKQLALEGVQGVLRLPADLPLLQTRDVAGLISADAGPGSALMVPAGNFLGTNALLRNPPDLFPSRFGPDSFRLHLLEALKAGAHTKVIENRRIALDLDDEDDLALFMKQPSESATYGFLLDAGIPERMSRRAD